MAISHKLSGLLIHTCTINSDDVEDGFRIGFIFINSDDVRGGGFRIATISIKSNDLKGGLHPATISIHSDESYKVWPTNTYMYYK